MNRDIFLIVANNTPVASFTLEEREREKERETLLFPQSWQEMRWHFSGHSQNKPAVERRRRIEISGMASGKKCPNRDKKQA